MKELTTIRALTLIVIISTFVCQQGYGAASASAAKNPSDVDRSLEACKKLITQGRTSDALAGLNSLKQKAPQDSRLYFFSGIALAEAKQMEQAVFELEQARRLSPKQPEYAVAFANVLSLLGRKVEALEGLNLFEQPELLNQLAPDWLWLLCDVYYRMEKTKEATKVLDLYVRRKPHDPSVPLRRAQISIIDSDFDRAEDYLKKAKAVSPGKAEIYFELGKVFWLRNELQSSKENSLVAVRRDPTNAEYLYQLARVCMALNEINEALRYLERAEGSGADRAKIYRALGEAHRQLGDSVKSKEYLDKFQQVVSAREQQALRDQEISNLVEQGMAELEKGRISKARDSFQRAIQLAPNNWLAHAYLAETYLSQEPVESRLAYPHIIKMHEIDPDSAEGNILTALYWYKQHDAKQARIYAERARVKRPGHAELRNLLGNIYFELGETNKALEEYGIAVKLAPERWDFKQNYQSTYRHAQQRSRKQPRK